MGELERLANACVDCKYMLGDVNANPKCGHESAALEFRNYVSGIVVVDHLLCTTMRDSTDCGWLGKNFSPKE